MHWQFSEIPEQDWTLTSDLHPIVARILSSRGIATAEATAAYLDPNPQRLTRFSTLSDMDRACERILAAIRRKESVTIYGDYDVDGVCSVALMVSTLKDYLPNLTTYIPDRQQEGYGLNIKAIESLASQGVTLLVTVDCGTSNHAEIRLATNLGMDTVVIDHHAITAELPPAYACINPKRADDTSASSMLCAAGVTFKVLEGLRDQLHFDYPYSPLDLVTLATIADVVPLLGENRVLATLGLRRLATSSRPGVRALIDVAGTKSINPYAIGFQLGPRLNAAGRMAHANLALELLLATETQEATSLAQTLNDLNATRRATTKRVFEAAMAALDESTSRLSHVLSDADWPVGLVGLVAGKIVEATYRPTLLIADQGEISRGSARSIAEIDITAVLTRLSDLFERFGGHAQAAGFEIQTARIPELRARLEAEIVDQLGSTIPKPTLLISDNLSLSQINRTLYEELRRLEPYGEQNERPLFASMGIRLTEVRAIGHDQTHLKAKISTPDGTLDIIGFGLAKCIPEIQINGNVDIAYALEENVWNGNTTLQLSLKDIRPHLPKG